MDFLAGTTTNPISETIMIGKTITAMDITIRSAVTAALPMRVALAADTAEALVAAGMASVAEASVVAMAAVVVMAVAAAIADRSNRA
jgi:hypothetical protein